MADMRWIMGAALLMIPLLGDAAVSQQPSAPKQRTLVAPLPKSTPHPQGSEDALAIDWPTVLELARASNLEIQLATEKVYEAHVGVEIARLQWLPSLRVGTGWYKNEGREQLIPGQIIDASKSRIDVSGVLNVKYDASKVAVDVLRAKQLVTARSGELDRASRKTLQEVSMAYIDLVAAEAGAAISHEIAELIGDLVERSKQMLRQGRVTQLDVIKNEAQYQSQLQTRNLARQNQMAAGAQLVRLLNLQSGTRLYVAEDRLVPVTLVDENAAEEDLVARALDYGPGLAEIVALLHALDQQERQLRRLKLFPTFEASLGQGAFGGGTGGDLRDINGRTEFSVGVYWDVMKMFGTRRKRNYFSSKRRQANLQHEQLNAKLAAAVIVARNNSLAARERIKLAEKEIELAIKAYTLSKARLDAAETISLEVMQTIGTLGTARKNYLEAVIDYNRAQIQLQYLVGLNQVEVETRLPKSTIPEAKSEDAEKASTQAG